MSKNKSVYDVLLQRTLSSLLNLSQADTATKVSITVAGNAYKFSLPFEKEKVLRVVVRVSDKGNLKIKATLDKPVKRFISGLVAIAKDNMVSSNDGLRDFTKVKDKLWKAYVKKAEAELRSKIIRSALASYQWTK
ncbi:hypothetical protein JA13_294 [Dickeya phage vB_DsoM_JA13]|uniref:Uncharacterized protein n=1 Tax=Dickeya phage vB_DsoM_JA13 TaxID=2283030 RepID=A0A384ZWT9_9CAUD|nr:hypothetical protein JA13_294 [Dickeya phage vB_DsoM_JA13]